MYTHTMYYVSDQQCFVWWSVFYITVESSYKPKAANLKFSLGKKHGFKRNFIMDRQFNSHIYIMNEK